ncbi:MBL fold metallo-hydrolase [Georgenia yuyongxinii]|uniref:MBL fold metallo-hydrolase n=1 Tax=Georgenia yuyongxinii TaxID=2589797 RepID=A0A5B8C0L5_9MICO|nr:MBL fold metallo-hydrolase [Georgenia yuyongxinii]QDC23570.1 MBL fold metallo-hydrolase [Georgenia yuyongxinii]
MRITHLGHACVLLETGTARLLLDPGTYAEGFESLRDLDAILLTHQHPDHADPARLPGLVGANPGARVLCDPDTAPLLADHGIDAHVVTPGEHLTVAGATIDVIGGTHAVIYADRPGCTNAGYMIDDGAFVHPGDSFADPGRPVDVLAVPTSGPWLKAAESVDYVRSVRPRVAVPIHERAMATTRLVYAVLADFMPEGTTFRPLEPGAPTEV